MIDRIFREDLLEGIHVGHQGYACVPDTGNVNVKYAESEIISYHAIQKPGTGGFRNILQMRFSVSWH
jgi:acyl CoA:acetate/3-ketoacid CoA transferase